MPRSFRALLSAEIRTDREPGSAGADALMGFVPEKAGAARSRVERLPAPTPE
jgi:hypothetical protein